MQKKSKTYYGLLDRNGRFKQSWDREKHTAMPNFEEIGRSLRPSVSDFLTYSHKAMDKIVPVTITMSVDKESAISFNEIEKKFLSIFKEDKNE